MGKMPSQNTINNTHAESVVERFSEEEKKEKIKELEEIGYEYNSGIHVLIEMDTIIPYDFVLYCLLMESIKNDTKENKDYT
jgi:hypothetical protein